MEGVRSHRGRIQIDFYDGQGERRRKTLPLEDTPANMVKASKMRDKILAKVAAGIFDEAEFFGESPGSKTTFESLSTQWIKTLENLSPETITNYESALRRLWVPPLGAKQVRFIKPSEVTAAIVAAGFKNNGTRNYALIPLRGVLRMAFKDRVTDRDLSIDIEDKPVTPREPHPFTKEQADLIIAHLRAKEEGIANLYQLLFYAGLRPSEAIALTWSDIRLADNRISISHVRIDGDERERTKTGVNRVVELNAKSKEALTRQRKLTALKGSDVFLAAKTGAPYVNEKSLRERHWKPALAALGISYREPYQTRHSYASWLLMAGANPVWVAKQLGHSVQELFKTYVRWIEAADQGKEMMKVEAFLVTKRSPETDSSPQAVELQG